MKLYKKILLLVIALFMSSIMFSDRAEAIVMWMQCTNSIDGKLEGDLSNDENYREHNTIAIINAKENSGYDVKPLIYNGSNFYDTYKPLFLRYSKDTTIGSGKMCWSSNKIPFDDLESCEIEDENFAEITTLLNGICPVGAIESSHIGTTKGDFLIFYGTKSAPVISELNEDVLIIYAYEDHINKDAMKHIMVESYSSTTGVYSFATNWGEKDPFDLNSFNAKNFGYPHSDDDDDLITETSYEMGFMSWEMMTQARRIEKLGKDYFKLTSEENALLVNKEFSNNLYIVDFNSEIVNFKSDNYDEKDGFNKIVTKWYDDKENLKGLSGALKIIKKFDEDETYSIDEDETTYYTLVDNAEKISKKLDENKKFKFSSDYNLNSLINDLDSAFNELEEYFKIEFKYKIYNKDCTTTKDTDKLFDSINVYFNCSVFGVTTLNEFVFKNNASLLNNQISDIISDRIERKFGSSIEIEKLDDRIMYYTKLLTKASYYAKKYASEDKKEEANLIYKKYEKLLKEEFDIEFVFDCETLLGGELKDKISSYLNIIKIVIPIILIGMGIIEFSKAMFSSDESKMKDAQMAFIKRFAISIIIFLTPTIINLLLSIANKVWSFIEPGSCGLF